MPVRTGSHTRADRFSVAILRLAVLVAIVDELFHERGVYPRK